MIIPEDVTNCLVALLQSIPELVAELGGDQNRIYAYQDTYPLNVNFPKALTSMPTGSVMVVYESWGIGSEGQGHPINHQLGIYARPKDGGSYSSLTRLLIDGIPAGQPLAMILVRIDPGLLPMAIEGRCSRELDSEGVEYWHLPISFNETWG